MPDASEFLSGFGFIQGSQISGYILTTTTSTHEAIKRYHEYKYSITLIFKNLGTGIYENLYASIYEKIIQEHIIYGIRNPYRCVIDIPQYGDILQDEGGTITFHLTGHSYRIYKTSK